jgi:NAD(P)-dependent dehydrogenase (short-subunit alcohol dehydrogenase family)
MLTRAVDEEGKAHGIRCFGIAPGLVDTAMQASIRAAGINEVSKIPQENLSDPTVSAGAIAWLASAQGMIMRARWRTCATRRSWRA